jgi:hypothetical protein
MRKGRVSVKLLIGDRGFKRKRTLDVGGHKTPKPKNKIRERAWSCAKGRAGDERTYGSGFHRDSIGSPRS